MTGRIDALVIRGQSSGSGTLDGLVAGEATTTAGGRCPARWGAATGPAADNEG